MNPPNTKDNSATKLEHKGIFALLALAVFCAGVASLLYEVLWVRQLGLSMGSTVLATSTMLSAFLGGLAVGSWIMGKRADSLTSPLRVLGIIELIAAVLGVLAIPMLTHAGSLYIHVATLLGGASFLSMVLRVLFSLIVMFVPALVFGMTFPLATAAGTRLITGGKAAGIVSAVSSFGSAAGAALCGLYLEPTLGIFRSALIGAGFNIVAGVLALIAARAVLERRKDPANPKEDVFIADAGFDA